MSDMRDLGAGFSQYFEILPALDDATRREVFAVRHEVYCRDLGWEPVREDGLETDAYDARSIHFLLRHRSTGAPVGCTRLVLGVPDAAPLPFQKSCAAVLHRDKCDPDALPPTMTAEVSRLAVMRDFRQRKGEQDKAVAVADDDFAQAGPRTRFPFIPVSLYLAVAAVALQLPREYVFVLTEPRLAQHFGRIGFNIEPIGDAIEHRGLRAPSVFRASTFLPGLRGMIKPLFEVVQASMAGAAEAASAQLRPR